MDDLDREYVHQEILEQPAIAARIAAADAPRWPDARRVVLAGCGDSRCAAELCRALFPERGIEAPAPMDASRAALGLGAPDALVGISVSGRTPRVREAVQRARARGAATVAVTDDPGSPLAADAAAVWPIGASPRDALQTTAYASPEAAQYVGYHHDVAQTKTFLAATLTLARAAGGDAVGQDAADAVARTAARACRDALRPRAEELAGRARTFLLGAGVGLPLARFGAYKLFEFDRAAAAADVEEYCHTHYFVTRADDAAVFLLTGEDDARRAAEVAPVLADALGVLVLVLRPADVALPDELAAWDVPLPAGGDALGRALSLAVGLEWLTYLAGRVGAPDVNTFHAGHDTEMLVGASLRTIRGSRIVAPEPR